MRAELIFTTAISMDSVGFCTPVCSSGLSVELHLKSLGLAGELRRRSFISGFAPITGNITSTFACRRVPETLIAELGIAVAQCAGHKQLIRASETAW